jgi:hypothetical protein
MLEVTMKRYSSRLLEDVFVLFHDLIHFLLLHGEASHELHGCECNLLLTLRENQKEEKLPVLRNYLSTLLDRDKGNNTMWDDLRYPIQFHVQSNNNTVMPRIIST